MSEASCQLTIRTMRPDEVGLAIEWAAREEWNPGLHDARHYTAADPDGFIVGERDGEPVSCISAVRYGTEFGFVGFYLVRPDQRGQGYGLATWRAAMARLDGRVAGLDGVLAQVPNYERWGFAVAYHTIRYGGHLAGAPGRAEPADRVAFEALAEFDAEHFGYRRDSFLRSWLAQPDGRALAIGDAGDLRGYGVIRRCRTGHRFGPLFARDAGTARELLLALADGRSGPHYLDVPVPNQTAGALARELGLTPGFETARMYRGHPPRLPLQRIYGVTSLELG